MEICNAFSFERIRKSNFLMHFVLIQENSMSLDQKTDEYILPKFWGDSILNSCFEVS